MDIEKLISLMFESRSLWDMREKTYHNRDISRKKWEKISQEMDANLEAIKNKWRGLRDTFRKELNKLPKKRSGDEGGAVKESLWPYFKSMMFLKDQFLPRKMHSSVPESDTCSQISAEGFEDMLEDEFNNETNPVQDKSHESEANVSQPEIHNVSENFAAPQTKRPKSTKSNAIEKLLNIEQNKLDEFRRKVDVLNKEKNKEDADYHFLMSLLPYLRKVPEERKMFVRTRLQQVFCDEEIFGQQRPYYSIPSSSQHHTPYGNPSSGASSYQTLESLSTSPKQLTELTTSSGPSTTESAIGDDQTKSFMSFFSIHNPNN